MDRAERNALVEKNIGLVHACANKFRGKGAEYDDLFQAGCVGLIKAAENFDPERGFSFSTYAVPVILGEIKRIFRDGGSVKVGRALKEKARKAQEARERAEAEEAAAKLKDVIVTVRAKAGANGRLFGSVTSQEIVDALREQHGVSIEKNRIVQAEPIKSFGSFEVKCKFGYGIDGTVQLLVIEK